MMADWKQNLGKELHPLFCAVSYKLDSRTNKAEIQHSDESLYL